MTTLSGIPIDPASIPQHVVDAALGSRRRDEPMRNTIAAALVALGCEWDDDQGANSMRRIVGAWIEKP